jgi:hypothetical protein
MSGMVGLIQQKIRESRSPAPAGLTQKHPTREAASAVHASAYPCKAPGGRSSADFRMVAGKMVL